MFIVSFYLLIVCKLFLDLFFVFFFVCFDVFLSCLLIGICFVCGDVVLGEIFVVWRYLIGCWLGFVGG